MPGNIQLLLLCPVLGIRGECSDLFGTEVFQGQPAVPVGIDRGECRGLLANRRRRERKGYLDAPQSVAGHRLVDIVVVAAVNDSGNEHRRTVERQLGMPRDIAADEGRVVIVGVLPDHVRNRGGLPVGHPVHGLAQADHPARAHQRLARERRQRQHLGIGTVRGSNNAFGRLVDTEPRLRQHGSHRAARCDGPRRALRRIVQQPGANRRSGKARMAVNHDRAHGLGGLRGSGRVSRLVVVGRLDGHLQRCSSRFVVEEHHLHATVLVAQQFGAQPEHPQEVRQPVAERLARCDDIRHSIEFAAVAGDHPDRGQFRQHRRQCRLAVAPRGHRQCAADRFRRRHAPIRTPDDLTRQIAHGVGHVDIAGGAEGIDLARTQTADDAWPRPDDLAVKGSAGDSEIEFHGNSGDYAAGNDAAHHVAGAETLAVPAADNDGRAAPAGVVAFVQRQRGNAHPRRTGFGACQVGTESDGQEPTPVAGCGGPPLWPGVSGNLARPPHEPARFRVAARAGIRRAEDRSARRARDAGRA